MRVFVTGASGYIGAAVVAELLGAGHQVIGLARSDDAAAKIAAAGAEVKRGDLEDMESLRSGAATADGVIHLAYFHQFTQARLATRLGVLLRGSPRRIVARFMEAAVGTDRRAIETLGAALAGPNRALVIALPTMTLAPGRLATEEDAPDRDAAGGIRGASEATTLALASRGVRASVVRIPPVVHDEGDKHGLLPSLITIARQKGVAAYVGDGHNRWAAVHRLDIAHLFRLAIERGEAGARYHAVAEEGIPFRDIATVIGQRLKEPIATKSSQEAASHFGWLASFVATDNPVSSALTQQRLGWRPQGTPLMPDMEQGHYFNQEG